MNLEPTKYESLEAEAIKMMLSQNKLNEEGLALRLYLITVIETFKAMNKKIKTNYNTHMIRNLEQLASDYDKALSAHGLISDKQFTAMKKAQLDVANKTLYPAQTKKKK
ncbi:TPA_asm: hypothetical protein GJJ62_13905 [Listeria monocytogenes]|uniref:hypothetical protein n=1 Tax=Listeria monocytogenes TaxID=1639 RepID=UPI00053BE352|nr:hypothetical protein [Listeria monocytogenes]EAA0327020.1 hypothetical protein [Listeria monocytogenes]EAC2927223.1 hypothetical protein [Listeria monocytogenes]EAC2933251.1 hypothetical protein [Listeria monocytogenes]EAC3120287.1 hypothetical protein [Listeria monocytogenes]EAC3165959.1 hypothetical protein [Listeria monocytogenes]